MITKTDLQDQIGTSEPRPVLYCRVCQSTCSANKGDYFNLSDSYKFKCCDKPMVLAIERKIMDIVKQ